MCSPRPSYCAKVLETQSQNRCYSCSPEEIYCQVEETVKEIKLQKSFAHDALDAEWRGSKSEIKHKAKGGKPWKLPGGVGSQDEV